MVQWPANTGNFYLYLLKGLEEGLYKRRCRSVQTRGEFIVWMTEFRQKKTRTTAPSDQKIWFSQDRWWELFSDFLINDLKAKKWEEELFIHFSTWKTDGKPWMSPCSSFTEPHSFPLLLSPISDSWRVHHKMCYLSCSLPVDGNGY